MLPKVEGVRLAVLSTILADIWSRFIGYRRRDIEMINLEEEFNRWVNVHAQSVNMALRKR